MTDTTHTATVIESLRELAPNDTVFVDPQGDVQFDPPLYPKGTVTSVEADRRANSRTTVNAARRNATSNFDLTEENGEIRVPDVGPVTVIRLRSPAGIVETIRSLERDEEVVLHLDTDKAYQATVTDVLVDGLGDPPATGHVLVNIALRAYDTHVGTDLDEDDLAVFGSWDAGDDPVLEVSVWSPTEEDVNARETLGTLARLERLEDVNP